MPKITWRDVASAAIDLKAEDFLRGGILLGGVILSGV